MTEVPYFDLFLEQPYDVSADLIFTIDLNNHELTHVVKQPTLDVLKSLDRKFPESLSVKGDGVIDNKEQESRKAAYLWELTIQSVDGYGSGKNSTERVPVLHQIAIAKELLKTKWIDNDDIKSYFSPSFLEYDFGFEYSPVFLTSIQGNSLILTCHVFKQPDLNDCTEYEEIIAYSQKTKKNKLSLTAKQTIERLCNLYDKLIGSAHGYKDQKGSSATEITSGIPAFHKKVAVKSLMESMKDLIGEEEKN